MIRFTQLMYRCIEVQISSNSNDCSILQIVFQIMAKHFTPSTTTNPWLLRNNFPKSTIDNFKNDSSNEGGSTGSFKALENQKIVRYKKYKIQSYITKWMENKVPMHYDGINGLCDAVERGELRVGQIIFERVTLSHHQGIEQPLLRLLTDKFSPVINRNVFN